MIRLSHAIQDARRSNRQGPRTSGSRPGAPWPRTERLHRSSPGAARQSSAQASDRSTPASAAELDIKDVIAERTSATHFRGLKLHLVWSPEAEADLLSMRQVNFDAFSPPIGSNDLRDIQRAAAHLSEFPEAGDGTRREFLPRSDQSSSTRPGPAPVVEMRRLKLLRVVDGRRNLASVLPNEWRRARLPHFLAEVRCIRVAVEYGDIIR